MCEGAHEGGMVVVVVVGVCVSKSMWVCYEVCMVVTGMGLVCWGRGVGGVELSG